MKLAIIRSEVSFTKGGAERYAANLCRELCRLGHQVWVLSEIFDSVVHPEIIHIPIPVNRTTSSARNNSFNKNAQAAVRELEVDQIVALSRSFPSDAFRVSDPLHCFWMQLRYPGRVRRFFENLNPRHRTILKLEKAIVDPENTRLIITNSKLSKKLIGRFYNYPQDRINVIYNGVDQQQFQPDFEYKEEFKLKFLFVGQDFKRKGLAEVIDAFAATQAGGFQCNLRVIGRDDPAPYREQAKNLGVLESISFEGPTKEIQRAYQTADLFIFPSLYDPFANVVLESLACGLPVLTTTTNGSSEIITEGANGYVVEGATNILANDLAECMNTFCNLTKDQRAKMRTASIETASKYSIKQNAEKLVETLCQ